MKTGDGQPGTLHPIVGGRQRLAVVLALIVVTATVDAQTGQGPRLSLFRRTGLALRVRTNATARKANALENQLPDARIAGKVWGLDDGREVQIDLPPLIAAINGGATARMDALHRLGLTVDDAQLTATVAEHGHRYRYRFGDRRYLHRIAETLGATWEHVVHRVTSPSIHVHDQPFFEEGTNYAGWIEFERPDGGTGHIYMTGEGTHALEGRDNDIHAGVCTGASCAGFQQKVAILLASLAALGVDDRGVHQFADAIVGIDAPLHGRMLPILYAVHQVTTAPDRHMTYLQFAEQMGTDDDSLHALRELLPNDQAPGPGRLVDRLHGTDEALLDPDYTTAALEKDLYWPHGRPPQ